MKLNFQYGLTLFLLLAISTVAHSQEIDFEQLALSPKSELSFPLDHMIARPRLAYPVWDNDYDAYYGYLTPTLRKTQAALTSSNAGVVTTFTPNSIMPHAQLDTSTLVPITTALTGTWRMLAFRSIRFNDSVDIPTKQYFRLADSLLEDKSKDEAFAVFSENHFKLYARPVGKATFKKELSTKYGVESRRYLLIYKLFKTGAGVAQFGLDEKGYLILNYPRVIEKVNKGRYFSYYTIIDQYIFEKIH